MKINPSIQTLDTTIIAGLNLEMNLVQNLTGQLWQSFGPHISSIPDRKNNHKISLQIYPQNYFAHFNPKTSFIKWAGVEVKSSDNIPIGLECMVIPEGLYAVFHYKGSSADSSIFNYIYSQWLPSSEYELDNRPHFEVLGDLYKNNDPDSEEDIWIPIKQKSA